MLRMRIERAPLKEAENRSILDDYNRLTGGRIPVDEFVHWVSENPAGAAWHALLETDEGRIVGHTSVFPLRTNFEGGSIIPAKSEYSFMHEDFRKEKIHGYEGKGRSGFIALLDELFKHCRAQGWGPIFASTNEKNQVFTRKVGLRPIEFDLCECLFILRPREASGLIPNMTVWKKIGLTGAGMVQNGAWSILDSWISSAREVLEVPVQTNGFPPEHKQLGFFEDPESLRWRYLEGQYVRLDLGDKAGNYVIAKRGGRKNFLRVCQWRLEETASLPRILPILIREAKRDGSVGVRWAIYSQQPSSEDFLKQMRRKGFICVPRKRIVMVHNSDERYMTSAIWRMNDSLFSFDPQ
jgi:GNAT superfamily N-acetyltransferase